MVPTRMPSKLLAFVFFLIVAVAGCTTPCMEIQQIMCSCEGQTQDARNFCEDAAKAQADLSPPTNADERVCESLLPGCQAVVDEGCDKLQTQEGKRACGLAVD